MQMFSKLLFFQRLPNQVKTIDIIIFLNGAEEMAQSMKDLLHNHENLSLDPPPNPH